MLTEDETTKPADTGIERTPDGRITPTETGVDRLSASLAFPELTLREREVARLLVRGESNREISRALGCSVKTVDTHRAHVLKKLGLRNNVDLARLAIRRGHIEP